jgi:O-antigen ligase
MLLTLSRGLMLDLIILAIAMVGFTATRYGTLIPDVLKSVVVILSALAVAVGLYFAVRFAMPPVGQFIDEFFITKLQNSFTEVSGTNLETRNQIMTNYRAFELERVMQQFREQSVLVQWLGQGWGSTLEFGFETASSKSTFSRTNAPFLHNGYAYYLMKTGIVGLLLYIVFLSHVTLRATASKTWPRADFAVVRRRILLAAVGVLASHTVTAGGLGFPAIYFGLLTLLAACYGPVWGPDSDEWQPAAAALSRTVNGSLSVKENRWSSADDEPSSLA